MRICRFRVSPFRKPRYCYACATGPCLGVGVGSELRQHFQTRKPLPERVAAVVYALLRACYRLGQSNVPRLAVDMTVIHGTVVNKHIAVKLTVDLVHLIVQHHTFDCPRTVSLATFQCNYTILRVTCSIVQLFGAGPSFFLESLEGGVAQPGCTGPGAATGGAKR